MEAFLVPKGTAVEVYATTLHYAPCGVKGEGFKVGIVLPAGTNYPLETSHSDGEDKLITAKNKWLIGHKEGGDSGKQSRLTATIPIFTTGALFIDSFPP